ncbi:prepilin peptidase [Amycolatopsis sp. cmx-11-12]|uniref:prepilin peptidase n=1 Tax=Amycolatopsis sp. cmx-11-12 TaxID=2785795 RepID=UPI003917E920
MNAISIVGWGLVGLVVAGGLRVIVQGSSVLPEKSERLAPPAVLEATTAVLFVALAWRIGPAPDLFAYSWLAAASVALATIDWGTRQLPTKLIWPSGIVLAVLFGVAAVVNHDAYPLFRSAAGMLALLGFYGALYFLRPGQLGGGDLRLGGVLGLALGWAGWPSVVTGTIFGWLTAAIALLILRVVRRQEPHRDLPLGPFLVIGAFAAVLAGPGA